MGWAKEEERMGRRVCTQWAFGRIRFVHRILNRTTYDSSGWYKKVGPSPFLFLCAKDAAHFETQTYKRRRSRDQSSNNQYLTPCFLVECTNTYKKIMEKVASRSFFSVEFGVANDAFFLSQKIHFG